MREVPDADLDGIGVRHSPESRSAALPMAAGWRDSGESQTPSDQARTVQESGRRAGPTPEVSGNSFFRAWTQVFGTTLIADEGSA